MRKTWKNTIGFLSPEKATFCEHVIKEHVTEDSICLEIGTYCGKSTLHLLEHGNPKTLITIDNYSALNYETEFGTVSNPKTYTFESNQKLFKDYPQVQLINGTTPLEINLPVLDYIYIDGGHSYQQKVADLEWVYPNCKEGTVIVLDDWDIQEVQDAIKYFCNKYSQTYVLSEPQYPQNTQSKIVIKNT